MFTPIKTLYFMWVLSARVNSALIFFSAKNRFSLNTGLYAHPYIDSEYCNSLVQLITNHTFDSKTLYIPVPRLLRFLDLNCTKIDAILVCRKI